MLLIHPPSAGLDAGGPKSLWWPAGASQQAIGFGLLHTCIIRLLLACHRPASVFTSPDRRHHATACPLPLPLQTQTDSMTHHMSRRGRYLVLLHRLIIVPAAVRYRSCGAVSRSKSRQATPYDSHTASADACILATRHMSRRGRYLVSFSVRAQYESRITHPPGTITDCRRNDNETMQQVGCC